MFVSQRSRKDLRDIKRKEILGVLQIHGGLCSPIDILEGSLGGSQCRGSVGFIITRLSGVVLMVLTGLVMT